MSDIHGLKDEELIEKLQRGAFDYFMKYTNIENGLVADVSRTGSHCSIAAVGFALASYPVAVKNGWIGRQEAAERALASLNFFDSSEQGTARHATGHRGFYYHFLKMDNGARAWNSELSTIDTALFLMGALTAAAYFTQKNETEDRIWAAAQTLYELADWRWALNKGDTVSMGWKPGGGFLRWRWQGYNEAILLYILGLASPTHPISQANYDAFASTYTWMMVENEPYLYAGPLFIHLFSHAWIDFRGIADSHMREKNSDYFRNTQLAIHVQRNYAERNPNHFVGYNSDVWGFTACAGPWSARQRHSRHGKRLLGYAARGAPFGPDDGTIAPWAPLSCLAFDRKAAMDGTRAILENYPRSLKDDRFAGAFNPSAPGKPPEGWVDDHCFAIDQGLLVLMIENERSGMIWDLMRQSPVIRDGLERAGFTGGWLDQEERIAARA